MFPKIAFTIACAGFAFGLQGCTAPLALSTPGAGPDGPVVLKNPYAEVNWAEVNQYLANLHCHTIKSDGRAEPDELIYMYADAGYSILAIADHDNYYIAREGERDPGPTQETTWPWTRWIDEEPARIWTSNGMETSAFYPDLGPGGMLAIRGNELSTHPHVVSLFNDCGFADTDHTEDERMACVKGKGGIAYWAHPSLYVPPHGWQNLVFDASMEEALEYFGDYIVRYDSMLGVEFNQNDIDARMPEPVTILDALLKAHYRDHDVFVFGSDDSHLTHVADNSTLTIVLAEDLSEESVRRALENGHTFVGQRTSVFPQFRGINVDEAAKTISVDAADYERITWIKDGEEYHVGDSVDFSEMEDAVLRFEVLADGTTFYSQAFFID